jgi:ribonuclease E
VVIDFIEMKERRHGREVEKTLRNALKQDKARTTVGRISRFGLLEMVRQRMGSSALSTTLEECPHCKGSGLVRNKEWRSLQILKEIYWTLCSNKCPNPLEYRVDPEMVEYILNNKRYKLAELENQFGTEIFIRDEVPERRLPT